MKTTTRLLHLALSCLPWMATAQQPHGLLTDLIEHTQTVWQNGYASNICLWETEPAIETLQIAEIRSTRPSFSWIVPGQQQRTLQEAYHIQVAESLADALAGNATVWNSGWVESNQSTGVLLAGNELAPGKNYFWRIKTRTNTGGESQWSAIKAFRTAQQLTTYQTPAYPQVKTKQQPATVRQIAPTTWLADFEKDAFGQLLITLASPHENDTVVVHLGECLKDGRIDRQPGGTIRYQHYTLPLLKGTHTYRVKIAKDGRNTRPAAILMPPYIGEVLPFRYTEVEGYHPPLAPKDLLREMVHYPFDDMAATFECSNDTLNQIWELCKYSIKATSFAGIYVDGDRERIPYEADALINQLCHYGVDREYTLARRSYEYLLDHPTWPTEWILQASQMAWYDYLYTGDARALETHYDILKARALVQLREKNGLISTTTGLQTPEFQASIRFDKPIKDIVDWPHTGILGLNKHEGGEADGFVFTHYNAVTNAYHYEALKGLARIAQTLQKPTEAAHYTQQAEAFKKRFNQLFFDTKRQVYTDGIDTSHASLHSNFFPLAFGLVPPARQKAVMQFIQSRGMACSVYGSQFLMDAIYQANDAAYGLQMLTKPDDRGWYNMIRVGSTLSLEAWDNKYKPNQDWNHAWGAAPANLIPRKLMGVEPLAPGFDRIRIKPQPASLAWAKAVIPTIKGAVSVSIQNQPDRFVLQFTLPANTRADVYIPTPPGNYKVQQNGVAVAAPRVKGEPFLYAGEFGSGTYELIVSRKP